MHIIMDKTTIIKGYREVRANQWLALPKYGNHQRIDL